MRTEPMAFASSARGVPRGRKGESTMKKGFRIAEMLHEYNFSKGVRGKYAKRYHQNSNVVVLEPDVAARFPNSEAVNQALRSLARVLRYKRA